MLTDEADIKIELKQFLREIKNGGCRVVVFDTIDAAYFLEPGSAKKHLVSLAREMNFTVGDEGSSRVELEGPKPEPPQMFGTIQRG